mmetsp:Transcript_12356/g.20028  ORF Transcript_12356/g.20028 Transcript_12356/m.20028 type:complete len:205 (+) Transcript_12356:1041-1655(+)
MVFELREPPTCMRTPSAKNFSQSQVTWEPRTGDAQQTTTCSLMIEGTDVMGIACTPGLSCRDALDEKDIERDMVTLGPDADISCLLTIAEEAEAEESSFSTSEMALRSSRSVGVLDAGALELLSPSSALASPPLVTDLDMLALVDTRPLKPPRDEEEAGSYRDPRVMIWSITLLALEEPVGAFIITGNSARLKRCDLPPLPPCP